MQGKKSFYRTNTQDHKRLPEQTSKALEDRLAQAESRSYSSLSLSVQDAQAEIMDQLEEYHSNKDFSATGRKDGAANQNEVPKYFLRINQTSGNVSSLSNSKQQVSLRDLLQIPRESRHSSLGDVAANKGQVVQKGNEGESAAQRSRARIKSKKALREDFKAKPSTFEIGLYGTKQDASLTDKYLGIKHISSARESLASPDRISEHFTSNPLNEVGVMKPKKSLSKTKAAEQSGPQQFDKSVPHRGSPRSILGRSEQDLATVVNNQVRNSPDALRRLQKNYHSSNQTTPQLLQRISSKIIAEAISEGVTEPEPDPLNPSSHHDLSGSPGNINKEMRKELKSHRTSPLSSNTSEKKTEWQEYLQVEVQDMLSPMRSQRDPFSLDYGSIPNEENISSNSARKNEIRRGSLVQTLNNLPMANKKHGPSNLQQKPSNKPHKVEKQSTPLLHLLLASVRASVLEDINEQRETQQASIPVLTTEVDSHLHLKSNLPIIRNIHARENKIQGQLNENQLTTIDDGFDNVQLRDQGHHRRRSSKHTPKNRRQICLSLQHAKSPDRELTSEKKNKSFDKRVEHIKQTQVDVIDSTDEEVNSYFKQSQILGTSESFLATGRLHKQSEGEGVQQIEPEDQMKSFGTNRSQERKGNWSFINPFQSLMIPMVKNRDQKDRSSKSLLIEPHREQSAMESSALLLSSIERNSPSRAHPLRQANAYRKKPVMNERYDLHHHRHSKSARQMEVSNSPCLEKLDADASFSSETEPLSKKIVEESETYQESPWFASLRESFQISPGRTKFELHANKVDDLTLRGPRPFNNDHTEMEPHMRHIFMNNFLNVKRKKNGNTRAISSLDALPEFKNGFSRLSQQKTQHDPDASSRKQENELENDSNRNAEDKIVDKTDIETNLGMYSPIVSSASSEDFRETFPVEKDWLGTMVSQVNRRKRNNRITYSVIMKKRKKKDKKAPMTNRRNALRMIDDNKSLSGTSVFEESNLSSLSADEQPAGYEQLYNEVIAPTAVDNIQEKYKVHNFFKERPRNFYPWNNYQFCLGQLKVGIEAIKHNFSDEKHKAVKLWISKDEQSICYKRLDASSTILDCLRGPRVISIRNIKGFMFGAYSQTFEKRKRAVLKELRFQKSLLGHIDEAVHNTKKDQKLKKLQKTKSIVSDKNNSNKRGLLRKLTNRTITMSKSSRERSSGRQSNHTYLSRIDANALAKSKSKKLEDNDSVFYSWQCVSLVLKNYTVDFVVKDDAEMMCLLHVLTHLTGGGPYPADNDNQEEEEKYNQKGCLRAYRWMKFRMKLSYQAWLRNIQIGDLMSKAIIQTLNEIKVVATYQLQQLIAKGGIEHNPDNQQQTSNLINTDSSEMESSLISSVEDSFKSEESLQNSPRKNSDGHSDTSMHNRVRETLKSGTVRGKTIVAKKGKGHVKRDDDQMVKIASIRRKRLSTLFQKHDQYFYKTMDVIQKRLKREQRQRKKVCSAIKHFIQMIQMQITYVTLLHEDRMNPFLHIWHQLGYHDMKLAQPQSTHFYLERKHVKKVLSADFGSSKRITISGFNQLLLAETRQSAKIMGKSGKRYTSKKRIQKQQINEMQTQMAQMARLRTRLCDIELLNINKYELLKRRDIAKQKRKLKRDRQILVEQCINDKRILKRASAKQIQNKYLAVLYEWNKGMYNLCELHERKYNARLRMRNDNELNYAKNRIRQLHLEMHALHTRSKRFKYLLQLNEREQENMSINVDVIQSMTNHFKKKHETFKQSIKEVTDQYGLQNTDFKHQLELQREHKQELKHNNTFVGGIHPSGLFSSQMKTFIEATKHESHDALSKLIQARGGEGNSMQDVFKFHRPNRQLTKLDTMKLQSGYNVPIDDKWTLEQQAQFDKILGIQSSADVKFSKYHKKGHNTSREHYTKNSPSHNNDDDFYNMEISPDKSRFSSSRQNVRQFFGDDILPAQDSDALKSTSFTSPNAIRLAMSKEGHADVGQSHGPEVFSSAVENQQKWTTEKRRSVFRRAESSPKNIDVQGGTGLIRPILCQQPTQSFIESKDRQRTIFLIPELSMVDEKESAMSRMDSSKFNPMSKAENSHQNRNQGDNRSEKYDFDKDEHQDTSELISLQLDALSRHLENGMQHASFIDSNNGCGPAILGLDDQDESDDEDSVRLSTSQRRVTKASSQAKRRR